MKDIMKKKRKRQKKRPVIEDQLCIEYKSDDSISDLASSSLSIGPDLQMIYQVYEGKLLKYTNMMKGWQFRWFILDPKTGLLSYFLNESERWKRPKGWTSLISAVIAPSDEDSNTFTVNTASGTSLKLRASDAKDRQNWINRMRSVSQLRGSFLGSDSLSNQTALLSQHDYNSGNLAALRKNLMNAEKYQLELSSIIEGLPRKGSLQHTDSNLLTLKSLSKSLIKSLNECFFMLHTVTI